MKKTTFISIVATSSLILGCSPESENSASFIITADNARSVTELSLSLASLNAVDFDELEGRSLNVTQSPNLIPRATESATLDCYTSGSLSITATVPDGMVDSDDIPASGSLSWVSDYQNCVQFDETFDGTSSISMSWTGYNGYEFGTLTTSTSFNNYSFSDDSISSTFDGNLSLILTEDNAKLKWDIDLSDSRLGGESIQSFTTVDISGNDENDYASSGAWRVNGGDDTYLKATIVANGVEVIVNDAQAVLYTWSELDL